MRDIASSDEVDPNSTIWGVLFYVPTLLLLTFFYTVQGVVHGLTSAMTFLLQAESNKYNYQALAKFSLVTWPVLLKLFWAPIVESVYSVRFGRRKSWIVPAIFTIGVTLLLLSNYVDNWLGRKPGGPLIAGAIKILPLTATFCWLILLTSTLDIAVDGLTLAELPKQRVGWISACSIIGLAIGQYLTHVIVLSIEYPSIWSWEGRTSGNERVNVITLSGFIRFWGIIFLSTALAVTLFIQEGHSSLWLPVKICCDVFTRKFPLFQTNIIAGTSRRFSCLPCTLCVMRCQTSPETLEEAANRMAFVAATDPVNVVGQTLTDTPGFRSTEDNLPPQGVILDVSGVTTAGMAAQTKPTPLDAYVVLLRVICLKAVSKLFVVIFLTKFCFAPMEAIFTPYLAEQGFPMHHLALLIICILPVRWFLPLLAVRWTTRAALLQTYITLGLAR
ncbi:unnamed protein product [Dicrocoelium dendriticum]|nr:unnamed protein product [Dicrocoelium dendriticum]